MNMAVTNPEENNADYAVSFRHEARSSARPARRANNTRRKRQAPQQFNGIHRRRRKKIRW